MGQRKIIVQCRRGLNPIPNNAHGIRTIRLTKFEPACQKILRPAKNQSKTKKNLLSSFDFLLRVVHCCWDQTKLTHRLLGKQETKLLSSLS